MKTRPNLDIGGVVSMEKERLPIYLTSSTIRRIDKIVFKKKMEGVYYGSRPYSRAAFIEEAVLKKLEEEEGKKEE